MAKLPAREASAFVSCLVSTTVYTLYTCPDRCTTRVPLIIISNSGDAVTVTLQIYKASSTTTFHVIGSKSLAVTDYIQLSDPTGIIVEAGDRIEVVATGGTVHVDALCTVIETFNPVG